MLLQERQGLRLDLGDVVFVGEADDGGELVEGARRVRSRDMVAMVCEE